MDPDRFCRDLLRGTPEAVTGRWLRGESARRWNALQAFWQELREIPWRCSEANIARLKLAWWQDQLGQPRPAHPLARALMTSLDTGGITALSPLVDALSARMDGRVPRDYFHATDGLVCRLWHSRCPPAPADPQSLAELGVLIGEARALLDLGADLRSVAMAPVSQRGAPALVRADELRQQLSAAAGEHAGGPGLLAALLAANLREVCASGLDPAKTRTLLPVWRMHHIALARRIGLGD